MVDERVDYGLGTSDRFVGRSFRAFWVSGFRSPMDSTGVLQSDPIPSRSSDINGVARSASAASRTGSRDAYLCADPLAACTRPGDQMCSHIIQPLASSLQLQEPNRGTPELESLLTCSRINAPAPSNRGQIDDPTRIVVLSEQREPKDLSRKFDPLFFASRRLIGMPSSGHDGTCPERSRGSRAESRPKSRVSTPEAARRLPLFSAFLIDTACQLEMNLTPAISTRIPFLIVAEMRVCNHAFRAPNFGFAAPPATRIEKFQPLSAIGRVRKPQGVTTKVTTVERVQ